MDELYLIKNRFFKLIKIKTEESGRCNLCVLNDINCSTYDLYIDGKIDYICDFLEDAYFEEVFDQKEILFYKISGIKEITLKCEYTERDLTEKFLERVNDEGNNKME